MTTLTPNIAPIRLLQTVGITTAALVGGMNFTISCFGIPAIMLSPPSLALKQWAQIYSTGSKVGPGISLLSMGSFAYLAWHNYRTYSNPSIIYSPFSNLWKGYLTAGLLAMAIVPYTFAFMMSGANSVNRKLHDAHRTEEGGLNGGKSTRGEDVHDLLERWAGHNIMRALLSTSAAVVGCWTALRLNL